ncbi:MAG: hypothetical protein WC145_11510 [Aliarcobacter sp.]
MIEMPTLEDIERIEKKVDALTAMLTAYGMNTGAPQVVAIKEICRIEHVSYTQITEKERYLLPRFGESAYPEGTKRWPMDEYLRWREVPVAKRGEMFRQHLLAERDRAIAERRSLGK